MILLFILGYIIIGILCYTCCFIWHCWNFKKNYTHLNLNFNYYYENYSEEMIALSIVWPCGILILLIILLSQPILKITEKVETIIKSKLKI